MQMDCCRRLTGREVEAELRPPGVQFGELPGLGLHREILMPRPRLVDTEFRNECIHLRVEFDHHLVGIVMITSQIVTRRIPCWPTELLNTGTSRRAGGT